ncbi:hypothetical protein E3V39_11785 [Gammaproteobacteria bacterium LSUCC0112]|nr:hypothetical protein E3V39_11785 [Gammaproteobacteria bacterium LSUCC0112]
MYAIVSSQLAQDRAQYYVWYMGVKNLADLTYYADPMFSVYLYVLPDNLTEIEFRFALMFVLSALLLSLVYLIRKSLVVVDRAYILIIIVILTDRLFLDFSFNATRSTIAALVFMHIFFVKDRIKLLFLAASLLTHFGIGTLLLVSYVISKRLPPGALVRYTIVIAALLLFSAKALFDLSFAEQFRSIDIFNVLLNLEVERVSRALTNSLELTLELSVQFFLGILVPLIFLSFGERKWNSGREFSTALDFALFSCLFGLLFYPEFILFQRLMVVPLIIFSASLRMRSLLVLSAVKIPLFFFFIGDYLEY